MKRAIVNILLVIVCFMLQCVIFYMLSVNGIVPNLLIVLTAACGFMQGERKGILIGFFCGVLIDIFFFDVLGFYALLYMYIGYMNGLFHNIFYPEDIKLPLILITLSDLIYSIVTYGLLFLLRSRFQFGFYFLNIILPEIVYTISIAILIYPCLLLIEKGFKRLEQKEYESV